MTMEILTIEVSKDKFDMTINEVREIKRLNNILSKRLNRLLQLLHKKDVSREEVVMWYNTTQDKEDVRYKSDKRTMIIKDVPIYLTLETIKDTLDTTKREIEIQLLLKKRIDKK